MKLSLDPKFITTAAITFVILVGVVTLANKLAGPAAASVAGTVVGAVAIKLFDKLDYSPSLDIEFGAPRISAPWIYSAVAAIFILAGCGVVAEIADSLVSRLGPKPSECSILLWAVVVPLDWAGYLLGGWVIGRLFSERALVICSLAAVVVFVGTVLDPDLISNPERLRSLTACITGLAPEDIDLDSARPSLKFGMIAGVATRVYLAIVMARLASRRQSAPTAVAPAA